MTDVPFRTTDLIAAPLDADVHLIEGEHDEFDMVWVATVTALDSETGEKVDALPAALVLAAAGQMLEALLAIRATVPLPEAVQVMVDRAIEAATG